MLAQRILLESIARMRNDAAHGTQFLYQAEQVSQALPEHPGTIVKAWLTGEVAHISSFPLAGCPIQAFFWLEWDDSRLLTMLP